MDKSTKFGVILLNLGTPDEPTPAAVRRYLAEFLWDKRVVDAPRWIWWFVLNCIILRFRPGKVAKLYASIWEKQGSPLMYYTQELAKQLESALTESYGQSIPVVPAMTYGNPSITAASKRFREENIQKLIVLPLYPQFSATTTAAGFDALAKQLKPCPDLPEILFVRDYHDHPLYIEALKQSVESVRENQSECDKLIMSFHGIPLRYHRQGDPYPIECATTSKLLAEALNLEQGQWMQTFQSIFGREEWLKPYTDATLAELPKQGVKHLQIMCPGFAVDCLETLEEIQEENKEIFMEAGGESFTYIPCLNDSESHVSLLKQLVETKAKAFQ
ncbi:MAG: ferrochelatase [Pseudomonadales bacterium]|nr:ferrochelatase [Pseudomonadales bacterium]